MENVKITSGNKGTRPIIFREQRNMDLPERNMDLPAGGSPDNYLEFFFYCVWVYL